jgi:hypothetical protein
LGSGGGFDPANVEASAKPRKPKAHPKEKHKDKPKA